MALTTGTAPFARPPGGSYNFDYLAASPPHTLYLEPVAKRVRGLLDGEVVIDSRRARLLFESNLMPQWYVPLDDVRPELLTATDHTTHCPFKGDARYWTVRVGDRVEENVLWGYPDPLPGAPDLAGLVACYFDRLDTWLEEEIPVEGHPRDPYHRFDCRRTSEHVEVRVGGETVAASERAVKLFETSLPVRYYLPRSDVRDEVLTPTDTRTLCPYKGRASYWTVRAGEVTVEDGAWTYAEPFGEAADVLDHLSFLGDGVEVYADGQPVTA